MKTLAKFVVAIMVMIVATSGMGFAQGMVYQTHQEMTLETVGLDGLSESWVQLPNEDYVRVFHDWGITIESTSGWTQTISAPQESYAINDPCIAQYNGTIWVAMAQYEFAVTINGITHAAPPTGLEYTILVKLNSAGSILASWQAVGAMNLTNIAVLSNTEIAVVGNASLVLEHLTSPNGGGVVLIHDGTDWDTSKGFFIETPVGGLNLVTSVQYLSNGNLALAGYTDGGTVSFGGISLPPHGSTDGFRGKITSTGTGLQAVQMASSGNDEHHLQITKADGSYMVTGTYTQPITFYNADGSTGGSLGQYPTGASHEHTYFAYYNASGVFQNAEVAYNNDAGTSLLNIDLTYGNDAFYAMIGNTNGGTMTTPTGSHNGAASITLKFDNTGVPVWSKQFETVAGGGNAVDFAEEILVDGEIVTLCGREGLTADLDFNAGVVPITAMTYIAEYNDGNVPVITAQPANTTGCEGSSSSFVEVTATNADSYQWYHDGSSVSGATDSILWFDPMTLSDAGDYYCEVSNAVGSVDSDVASVTVDPLVEITVHPDDVTVLVGESFTLTSAGNNVTGYQWYHDGTVISGATSATYTISSAVMDDAGDYYCELSNGCGFVNTDPATVIVNEPFASYDPVSISVEADNESEESTFETNDASAENVLSGDPGGSVSPINMGTGTTIVTVSYPENLDMASKQYVVTATTSPNGEVATFTVNQDGVDAFLTLSEYETTVGSGEGNYLIDIDCPNDMTWTATDGTFSVASPNSGTGPMTVSIDYEENTSPDQRVDILTFSGNGESADFTLTQVGAGSPAANFSADPLWGILTLTTQFTDQSTPGNNPLTSWDWDFGDGNTSDIQHPQHTYDFPGIYTVSLTVSDGNTSDTKIKTDYISVYEELIAYAGPNMGLELGQSTQFDGSYSGGSGDITMLWAGVNNSIPIDDPNILNPLVGPFAGIEVYYFTLTVTDNITGSESTDEMFVDVILGLRESQYAKAKVYPNPTTGLVSINSHTIIDRLSVFDMTGQEIINIKNPDNTTQIDLSDFPMGLYLVKILSIGKLNTYKIEKQ